MTKIPLVGASGIAPPSNYDWVGVTPILGVCDFCTADGPKWEFEVENFTTNVAGGPDNASVGNWAACDVCRALVEAEDAGGLWRRVWKMAPDTPSPAEVERALVFLWEMVFKHLKSPKAKPIDSSGT